MQNHPGYIIPEEPQPEGYYCLKVFIPADDLYLYAFSGAFQFFGKWLAWERDNAHRGTLAAQAWREAIQYTFTNGWLNCGEDELCEHCDLIPVILERLEELTNMNINVNCGCGCGGSGGGIAPPPPIEDIEPEDLDLPDPPDDTPIPVTNLQQKCNVANYMAVAWRNAVIRLVNETTTFNEFRVWFYNFWETIGAAYVSFLYGVWLACRTWLANHAAGWVADNIDPIFNDVVCAMYQSESPAQARENVEAIIGGLPFPLNYAAVSIAAYLPYEILFTNDVLEMPAGYFGRSCCGGVPEPPTPPGEEEEWEEAWGIVGGREQSYSLNTEENHAYEATTYGSGAGGSLQQGFDRLVSFANTSPNDWTHNVIQFTIELTIAAPVGNACTRSIRFGSPNQYTVMHTVSNTNGQSVDESETLSVWIGLTGETPPGVNDIEVTVATRQYLMPQFILDSVGYGAQPTTWNWNVSDFLIDP